MKISIVNYDNQYSETVLKLVERLGFSAKLITDEINICNSDVLILPDCNDLLKANRKLQLFNLSNVLKIINRKIIGINNGMFLMCSNFIGFNMCGLGLFHSDVYKFNNTQNLTIGCNNLFSPKSSCMKIDLSNIELKYRSDYYILQNDNTCVYTKINDLPITVINKYKMYVGFNFEFSIENEISLLALSEAIKD